MHVDAGPQSAVSLCRTHEVLYRSVLLHWRRSHAECELALRELHDADAAQLFAARIMAEFTLGSVLRARLRSAQSAVLRRWASTPKLELDYSCWAA